MLQALQRRLDEPGLSHRTRAALQLQSARVWLASSNQPTQQPEALVRAAGALQRAQAELNTDSSSSSSSSQLVDLGTLHACLALCHSSPLLQLSSSSEQPDADTEQQAALQDRLASSSTASTSGRQHSQQALQAWQAAADADTAQRKPWPAASTAAAREVRAMLSVRGPEILAQEAHAALQGLQLSVQQPGSLSQHPAHVTLGLSCSAEQAAGASPASELRTSAIAQPSGSGLPLPAVQQRAEAHLVASAQWLAEGELLHVDPGQAKHVHRLKHLLQVAAAAAWRTSC